MSWREYVIGQLVAGPITIRCCDRDLCTWWKEDRSDVTPETLRGGDPWQMHSGRAWGNKRTDLHGDKRCLIFGSMQGVPARVRMHCPCGRNFERKMRHCASILDKLAEHQIRQVELSYLENLVC